MRKTLLLLVCLCIIAWIGKWLDLRISVIKGCAIYRGEQCVNCFTKEIVPVALKSNCETCPNRQAEYIAEGLVPAWACLESQLNTDDDILLDVDTHECPWMRPLKDMIGNCWPCETKQQVLLLDWQQGKMCQNRYYVPDSLGSRSISCPLLHLIKDAEVCVQCGGVFSKDKCLREGENHFCRDNRDCELDEWCYPFKIMQSQEKGVCVAKPQKTWFCTGTGGYDFNAAEDLCARQNAHIPTLEEIQAELPDVLESCESDDIWIFWGAEHAVWLHSLSTEFLFTRENERTELGGFSFHTLCRQN